jgi:tetratricopeptide (TPR) repeat protein
MSIDGPTKWSEALARRALRPSRWVTRTRSLTDAARLRRAVELSPQFPEYVHWMAFTAAHPDSADALLLSEFVDQFARLATNLGQADGATGDVVSALDAAIALQVRSGGAVTALYRAKASYFRSEYTESVERRDAIQAAIDSAAFGSEDWALATLDLCGYQVDVSRYNDALRTVRTLRLNLAPDLLDGKYECAAHAFEGVVLFTSFRDLHVAEERLRHACTYESRAADGDIGQWVAMAYHYLARIAEVRRRYRASLELYVKAQELTERSPELIVSDAFGELRIAEPLIGAGLFQQARDHLDTAYALVVTCSNRSSARLQLDLGYATLAAATGEPGNATRIVEDACHRAREVGFWRGELLCQGYLLALAIRQRRLLRLPGLALRILKGALVGELRRNGLFGLLLRVPVVLPVAVRRMSQTRRAQGVSETVTGCLCRRHAAAGGVDRHAAAA